MSVAIQVLADSLNGRFFNEIGCRKVWFPDSERDQAFNFADLVVKTTDRARLNGEQALVDLWR